MNRSFKQLFPLALLICISGLSQSAEAQVIGDRPDGITGVGIEERLGGQIPLDVSFRDSTGRQIKLSQLFKDDRPLILSFNYTDCPMLCKLQLSGLLESLQDLEWTAGQEYRVVSISIDPSETIQQAAISKQNHVQAYGRPVDSDAFHFLTGTPEAIRTVTDAAGFQYRYLPGQKEFSHAAAVLVCTPEGIISRYLYGVQFDTRTLRLSLAEASAGSVGSSLDQLILYCFQYDSSSGQYSPAAWRIMRIGAIGTVLLVAIAVLPFWWKSFKSNPGTGASSETNNV